MRSLYSILVNCFNWLLPLLGLLSKGKLRDFAKGRRHLNQLIAPKKTGKRFWFHCASLGEFEQARPVIERLKIEHPQCSIVISFFSPSGYNLRKDYALADLVCYLPIDTAKNARKFLDILQADVAVFVKYEIWYNHLMELSKRQIPTYLISATFRKGQYIFSKNGKWLFKVLSQFKRIFLQDPLSYNLLNEFGLKNIEISGDTRYDRVKQTALAAVPNTILEEFKGDHPLIIFGSSWPEEEKLAAELLKDSRFDAYKIVLAPHDISISHINDIVNSLNFIETCKYTSFSNKNSNRVMVLDTIGHLASAYLYADLAFIGGGYNKGLHNILEALAFGVPVIFGPNVDRYPEARESISAEVAMKVHNLSDIGVAVSLYLSNGNLDNNIRAKCIDFINWHSGASDKVIKALNQ